MLDDRMRMILEAANTLTAEDLEFIRSDGLVRSSGTKRAAGKRAHENSPAAAVVVAATETSTPPPAEASGPTGSRGAYERNRTRESKVSTECLGEVRAKHPWWPVGTELVGRIGAEVFTAVVVENANVKSGRSLKITSGAAQGRICITPTRAAIEATEAYRQAHNLGRGGGVTNGWSFWKPKS